MNHKQKIINRIFEAQENGLWKVIPEGHNYHPVHMHYVPNFKSTLWTLVLLADLKHDPTDPRVQNAIETLQEHFYDSEFGIYTIKEDHFPIPCLNGNMIYIDAYFNPKPSEKSVTALTFFAKNQRFDDGCYQDPKSEF